LCAPPFVATCIFEDDMNEGTSDDIIDHVWETYISEGHDNNEVHNTDDESFNENSFYWSFHFNIIQENNLD